MSLGIQKTFILDMVPGGAPPIIHVSAGDVGRPFRANLLYNGETYDLDAVTSVTIRGTKPDKTVFEYALTFDANDSHVDFVIEEQMAIIAGQVLCEIRLFSGEDTIGSANFILDVEQNCFDPDASSESDIATISDYVAETVNEYLEEHPESIVAIPDGGVTTAKLAAGAVTSAKVDADFLEEIENAYVTPQMFGAAGDGTTDDTNAFVSAINSGKKVKVPSASYKLTSVVQSDCSIVEDNGTYTGLPLMVSRPLRTSPLVVDFFKKLELGEITTNTDKWLGGTCYDSTRDHVVMGFGDSSSTSYIVSMTADFSTVVLENTINAYHLNSLTYNETTDRIYAPSSASGTTIAVIDPATLTIESTITVNVSHAISSLAYWADYNLYIVCGDGHIDIADANFAILKTDFLTYNAAKFANRYGVSSGDINFQPIAIVDGQVVHLCDDKSAYRYSHLTQYKYSNNSLSFDFKYNTIAKNDEIESIVNVNGSWYALNMLGTKRIYINKLYFGDDDQETIAGLNQVIRLIDSGTYNTTYGTWNFKIYSDGTAECFGRMVLSTTSSTASGSGYYSDKISIPTPFTFDSSHSTIHGSMGSQTYLANPEIGEGYIGFRIMRLTSGTISDSTCRFYVRGRVYNYPNFNYTVST